MSGWRWPARETSNPSQGFRDCYVTVDESQRHDFLPKHGAAEQSFEDVFVAIAKRFMPGEEHALNVGEGAVLGEVSRIAVGVATVPGSNLFLENVADDRLVLLGWKGKGAGTEHHHRKT